jgi:DNA-directed RNA polymerase subunit beta
MLTIKSDDVVGRARAFEAIVKGTDIPEATVPESFRVLVRELNSLGLSIEAKGGVYTKDDDEEITDEAKQLAIVAGSEVVATNELTKDTGPMEIEEVI